MPLPDRKLGEKAEEFLSRCMSSEKMMNEFSKNNGWEYFVFLQPTMGLKGVQSNAPDRTNDRIIRNPTICLLSS